MQQAMWASPSFAQPAKLHHCKMGYAGETSASSRDWSALLTSDESAHSSVDQGCTTWTYNKTQDSWSEHMLTANVQNAI